MELFDNFAQLHSTDKKMICSGILGVAVTLRQIHSITGKLFQDKNINLIKKIFHIYSITDVNLNSLMYQITQYTFLSLAKRKFFSNRAN